MNVSDKPKVAKGWRLASAAKPGVYVVEDDHVQQAEVSRTNVEQLHQRLREMMRERRQKQTA
jgi:hypothetical protein